MLVYFYLGLHIDDVYYYCIGKGKEVNFSAGVYSSRTCVSVTCT